MYEDGDAERSFPLLEQFLGCLDEEQDRIGTLDLTGLVPDIPFDPRCLAWRSYAEARLAELAITEVHDQARRRTPLWQPPDREQVRTVFRRQSAKLPISLGDHPAEIIGRRMVGELVPDRSHHLLVFRLPGSAAPIREAPSRHEIGHGVWLLEPAGKPRVFVDHLESAAKNLPPAIEATIRGIGDPSQTVLGPFLHEPLVLCNPGEADAIHPSFLYRYGLPLLSLFDINRLGEGAQSAGVLFEHWLLEYLRHRRVPQAFQDEYFRFACPTHRWACFCGLLPNRRLLETRVSEETRPISHYILDLEADSITPSTWSPDTTPYLPPILLLQSLTERGFARQLIRLAVRLGDPQENDLLWRIGHAIVVWARACRAVEPYDTHEPSVVQRPTTTIREPETVSLFSSEVLDAVLAPAGQRHGMTDRIRACSNTLFDRGSDLVAAMDAAADAYACRGAFDARLPSTTRNENALTLFAAATRVLWATVAAMCGISAVVLGRSHTVG